MQTYLFYTPEKQEAYSAHEIADVLDDGHGFTWDGDWQKSYRSGQWVDPATRAICHIDIGVAEFNHDDAHDEKEYEAWTRNPIQVQIPLSVPHWYGVECLRFLEWLLEQLPGLHILDTEIESAEESAGPETLDRLRALANWEQLHINQTTERGDCYRMSRVSSVAMWRYRRAVGELDDEWPAALVLLDKDYARSAVVWDEPEDELIVPPVELGVLKTATNTIVMSVEEIISRAGHVNNLDCAGAVSIPIDDAFEEMVHECVKMDVSRFKFLGDGEWSD